MDKKWTFERHAGADLIKELKKKSLWNKLEADCKDGNVYLAIRNGYISFYHKGGNLFKFEKDSFSTHVKYATVFDTEDDSSPKDYIKENQLEEIRKIKSFNDGYEGIKKNCELYSGLEAKGVANLYQNSSYIRSKSIFVLDIEIAFKKNDRKQDRIDILLYNNDKQTLRFVEAKLFSNSELWSTSTPPVITQIEKYEEQLDLHKEELIPQYGQYIDELNQIFGLKLNAPKKIEPKVSLLIFGFDDAQKRSDRFKDLIRENQKYIDVPIYCKGDPKGLLAETLWKGAK